MKQTIIIGIAVSLLTLGLIGCQTSGGGGPNTWLDTPLDGMEFDVQEPVTIMAHASDASGVTRFEFYVDEKLIAVDAGSGGRLGKGDAGWLPTTAGSYSIHARATNGAGNVGADAISHIVVHDAQQVLACCPVPREKGTETPTPTATPPIPPPSTNITITPPPTAAPQLSCAFDAVFVSDVTVPPGTALALNQSFNKIWRVRNSGTCAWDANVRLDYVGGEALTTQQEIVVPATAPGATADLLVAMTAPNVPGQHYTQWRMRNTQQWFGPGLEVWINLLGSQPPPPPPAGCPGPPVIASFSASATTITAGQSTTLSWGAVTNATSASIDPDIGGVAAPGSVSVRPNRTTTYTLTASGCGGTVRRQVMVNVSSAPPPPGVTLVPPVYVPTNTPGFIIYPTLLLVNTPPPPADTTPPSISNVQFTTRNIPRAGCGGGQVTVTATVTDPSGVASVVARLSGTQSGDVSMGPVGGNVYLANLGPFSNAGQLTIYIVARDNRGNTGQSGPNGVTVTDCSIK